MCNCETCKYKEMYENNKKRIVEYNRKKREERLEKGLCSVCGKNPLMIQEGVTLSLCKECNDKQKNRQLVYQSKKRMLKKNIK